MSICFITAIETSNVEKTKLVADKHLEVTQGQR